MSVNKFSALLVVLENFARMLGVVERGSNGMVAVRAAEVFSALLGTGLKISAAATASDAVATISLDIDALGGVSFPAEVRISAERVLLRFRPDPGTKATFLMVSPEECADIVCDRFCAWRKAGRPELRSFERSWSALSVRDISLELDEKIQAAEALAAAEDMGTQRQS